MKKTVFALSVAAALAGFAGAASAAPTPYIKAEQADINNTDKKLSTKLSINAGAVGHILVQPYYTVQGTRNTLMNIINTDTKNGKAVKVRFRGARNSDDVFDFYVFLSPGDVWRARVWKNAKDEVRLDIPDTSCTLPARSTLIDENNEVSAFSTARVYDKKSKSETFEGYVEFLTVADIEPGDGAKGALYNTIKHNSVTGNVECNPTLIANSMAVMTSKAEVLGRGFNFPTAGITGHWAITEVVTDSTVTGNMMAIAAVDDDDFMALGNLTVAPQSTSVAHDTWDKLGTADPLFRSGKLADKNYDYPDLSTPYLSNATGDDADPINQANALSEALAASEVMNEFVTVSDVKFRTDWVLSLPTRRYGVAVDYASGAAVFNDKTPGDKAASDYFTPKNAAVVKHNGAPQVHVDIDADFYDDNERTLNAVPSPHGGFKLDGEVSVLTFNVPVEESVLGAAIAANRVNPKFLSQPIDAGWGKINLVNRSGSGKKGLPVIGFAALQAGGKALGFTWPHSFSK